MVTQLDLHEARERVEEVETQYLHERGWRRTSSGPGCLWVWTTELEGKTVLVDQRHALAMQHALDGDADMTIEAEG